MSSSQSIGAYLIEQLHTHGIGTVFGIPGDYVLGFYDQLHRSSLRIVNTCDEQGAGFAADAYARVRGLGAVCITYCVGGLKVTNTTAQAFAEKSPVVVISGAPGINERRKNPLLHHKVKEFDTQKKVFDQLTAASTVIDDPQTAFPEIDRVLYAALRYKRPVYIELPRDMVQAQGVSRYQSPRLFGPQRSEKSDANALREALGEAVAMINAAVQPVIIADVELHRFGLQDELLELAKQTNIPVAATILGKSVIGEHHPFFLGIYEGAMGRSEVRDYVENSDCFVLLGMFMTDLNLGLFTARIDQGRSIYVTSERTSIRYHDYANIRLQDFLHGLIKSHHIRPRKRVWNPHPEPPQSFVPERGKAITIQRLYQCLNAFINEQFVIIADVGDALFAASDLFIHSRTEFIAPAYYTSMGFAVPGSIGAQMANAKVRPLVLVRDGAFQMTGMEVSTAVRFGLNPIVIVLNNSGYGTERPMQDGPFNDLPLWRYDRIPELVGSGLGLRAATEDELDKALEQVKRRSDSFCLLEVKLAVDDHSQALQRLTERMAHFTQAGSKIPAPEP